MNIIESLKKSTVLKLFLILIILLLLLIPLEMVKGVIYDRYTTNDKVSEELTTSWGGSQIINGPFIVIPIEKKVLIESKDKETFVIETEYLHFLPKTLDIQSDIKTEELKRSIYQAVVYQSDSKINGSFDAINLSTVADLKKQELLLSQNAEITIIVSDLLGVKKLPIIKINGQDYKLTLRKRNGNEPYILSAQIPVETLLNNGFNFELDLNLSGSGGLIINPIAEDNKIAVKSNWPDPSFNGNYITLDKTINKDGFQANWQIPKLLNETPNIFKSSSPITVMINRNKYSVRYDDDRVPSNVQTSAHFIEINFFDAVNNYTKSEKIVKYAVLVIILTFVSIFLSEIYSKVRIHVVNYLLIGLGIVVFYLLLLSISEFLNFNLSYVIAGLATIILITSFIKMLVPNKKVSYGIGFILTLLYIFIYMLIQLQEHALLVGSIGLFVILAILMRFSAKFRLGSNE